MRPSTRLVFVLSLLIISMTLAVSSPVAAKKSPDGKRTVSQLIMADEVDSSTRRGNLWINDRNGSPVAIQRVGYPVTPDSPEAMARQYLSDHAELFRFTSAGLSDLEYLSTWESPAGYTARFRQLIDGVPVDRSDLAVTINKDFVVSFVTNNYQPDLSLASSAATMPQAEARAGALDYLGASGSLRFDETGLIVYHRKGVARLAWQTRVVPATAPSGDWEVLTDAQTGEIFKVVDRAHYVDGDGGTFDPDPLSSAGATYGDPGYVDGNDADTPELLAEIFNRTLLDIEQSGGMHHLRGPWAEIRDFEGPFNGLYSQASSTFDYTRFEDGFEAVLCYFHIDHIMRYLNVDLGVVVGPYQYSGGARYDPHALNGADNSYYSSSTGAMAFGEGGVDDSEDADVVIHELGHGLHDWVTGGHLSQVNGLSEGTGDYIAASYSRSLGQWLPSDPQHQWVFSWDGHNPFWGGRVTDYFGHYPEDLVGQIHTDGQIWSTCNMRIWDEIGRDQLDRAFWVGLGMTGSSTNQEQAAAAVLQAAIDLGYPGSELTTMHTIYSDCGYDVGPPPAGLNLVVTGSCPGVINVDVSGATPTRKVAVYFGRSPGSTVLPSGPCAGTTIDLGRAKSRRRGRADGNGDISFMLNVPPAACRASVQALDAATCTTSNIAPMP